MSFNDEYLKLRKKRLAGEEVDTSNDTGAPRLLYQNKTQALKPPSEVNDDDIAPVRPTTEEEDKKWYQKIFKGSEVFDDGWDFGDGYKAAVATTEDLKNNIYKGFLGIVEGAIDTGASIIGDVGGMFGATDFRDKMDEFAAREIINKDKVASGLSAVNGGFVSDLWLGKDKDRKEELSVSGDTMDSWAQSGGQLLGVATLGAANVPWWLTTGVTSYGNEFSNALNQGATHDEAVLSGAITAGAEILTEKISGGIKFGGTTWDDFATKRLATGISNRVVRTAMKMGMDVVGEGGEEVLSGLMSAVGQKLTYASDQEFAELFSSDDALEAFVGGAVLGGVSSGYRVVDSTVTHRDATTGLTANEEAVFKKVYEDALAEAEKGGKKLTTKQKGELYDAVMEDLKKGGIGTDTIEAVLGGDDYKAYKTNVDSEDALAKQKEDLQKEIDELNKMKLGEMTGEQRDRLEGLKDQFRKISRQIADNQRNAKSQLKSQLTKNVQNQLVRQDGKHIQKDDYLIESYNERARRGQAFEADVSKYDAKQQEIVKKAIESGVLNNTRRTHELVDMIAKISADKGVSFDFINNKKLKESGFAVDGKTVNGYYNKATKTIGVNIEGAKYLNSVVGHEVTHVLEGTEVYTELQKAMFEYAKSKGEYASRRKHLESLYKAEDIDSELAADLVGDYLFTDADFLKTLSTKHRNVFQKLFDEIKYLCKVATAGSKEKRELEKVKKLFQDLYRQSAATEDAEVKTKTKAEQTTADGGSNLEALQAEYDAVYKQFLEANRNQDADAIKRLSEKLTELNQRLSKAEADAEFANRKESDTAKYSLSDSDGKQLTKEQSEYFKDSKMRDENGNLKVMYHGSQDAGFHEFDSLFSDDNASFFFVDRNDVAASYSGSSETYTARTFRTAEDFNKFFAEIGQNEYEVKEEMYGDHKWFVLYEDGSEVASSETAKMLYDEFRDWSGLGEGQANYKVYLNLTNPLEIDAKGRPWNKIDAEFSQEVYDKYQSLTAEEKDALTNLAEWEDFRIFNSEIQEATDGALASAYAKMGEDCNIYDLFSVAADNFSEESMRENARGYLNTRDFAQRAKEQGYDGVIFKNLIDNGGYSNGSEGASTVAIAFDSNQIKSVANAKPTGNPDIRYSLGDGREVEVVNGIAVAPNVAEVMKSDEYQKPNDYMTQYSVSSTPAWEKNYLAQHHDEKDYQVVDAIRNFTDKMVQDDAVRGYVPTGDYKYTSWGPLRTNQEYIRSFDMDTSCPRTFQFLNFRDAIQRKAGRYLSYNESINLLELMRAYGQQIPCCYCYVENKRVLLSASYNNFFGFRNAVMTAQTDADAEKAMYGYSEKKGLPDASRKAMSRWRSDMSYNPSLTEVWTATNTARNSVLNYLDAQMESGNINEKTAESKLNKMVLEQFGITDKSAITEVQTFVRDWAYDTLAKIPHIYNTDNDTSVSAVDERALALNHEALAYAKSASSAKNVENYVPYTDQLKNISKEEREYIMGMGGIRKHSSNDFRMDYVQDYFLFYADLAADKWTGHTYTKSADFTKIFACTNDRINMSVAFYEDADGTLRENIDEGASWKDVRELRKAYKNVGSMAMVTSDNQLSYALNSDWIDMIIPFHASSLDKAVWYNLRMWNDYTSKQGERFYNADTMKQRLTEAGVEVPKGANSAVVKALFEDTFQTKHIYGKDGEILKPHFFPGDTYVNGQLVPGHHNDVATYFKLCEEYGVHPRFYGIKVTDTNGTQIDVTEHPSYLKLIKETSRTDSAQEEIQFNFGNYDSFLKMTPFEYAMKRLQEEAKNGGFENTKDDPYGVVDEFINEYLDKDRPLGYLTDRAKETREILLEMSKENAKKQADIVEKEVNALSLSAQGETPTKYGNFNISGDDVRLEAPMQESVAPVQEDVANNATTTPTISKTEQVAPEGFAPISEEQANALQSENIASITDEDAPPEAEAPYYEEPSAPASPKNPFTYRDYTRVGSTKTKAFVEENPDAQPYFQEAAQAMLGDLRNSQKGQRWYNDRVYYESGGVNGLGGVQRETTADIADLLDGHYHYSYQQIDDALNFIINGEKLNACAKRIEFALNDRLLNGYTDINGMQIPPNQEYINLLNKMQMAEDINLQGQASATFTDSDAPPATEDIGPVKPTEANQSQPKPTTVVNAEEKVAQIRREEPQKEGFWSRTKKKINDIITLVGDKGWAVENLAKKTNNRELEAKYDFYRNRTQGVAQEYINEKLFSIWDKIESSGKRESFDEYAYHLHNIDRMSLDSAEDIATRATLKETLKGLTEKQIETLASTLITRDTPKDRIDMILAAQAYVDLGGAKGKNKPVFGNSITADVSRKKVAEYEASNPEFKAWGEEVVAYNKALRELAVTEGLISQKTADLWEQMYPHYVPISRIDRNNASIIVPLDTNKTGVNSPFKRAEGGNSDFEPLLETMAKNTEQIFRAVFRNRFGVELMNTLKADSAVAQAIEEADPNEVLEGVKENDGAILKEGKNGIPASFTVFVKGKRVEFDIPDDVYEAVKPTTGELSKTYGILNKPSEGIKKLMTEYNPIFALWRNPIKDSKDVLHNSQHALKTYLTAPETLKEIATKGKWFQEYAKNGGKTNSYYDSKTKTFVKKPGVAKKVLGFPIHAYQNASQNIEMFWRLSEYIASRKEGRSIEVSMLDAARVTTNFGAGSDLTKFLNRNGAFFLNPSVQGAMQIGRNIREAHHQGLKGYAAIAGKVLAVGLGGLFLNHLLWGDDEDYEELSDYVKQNYFIVRKTEDGKFWRIPKGRMEAVIQNGFEQMQNLITGDDDVDLETFAELVANNLAPNDPFRNNIFSTISQIKNNETWYGEDLVPTRLQDLPAEEQYDESTDSISKWIGGITNTSPYKWNYLFQQYGGGLADIILPMFTPEAESGSESVVEDIVVGPWRDEIVTDSVLKNQNVSDFYDTVDELTKNANSINATDEDVLKSKYMNFINSQLSDLYKQKREIQNSDLDDSTKYKRVRRIQAYIDTLAKESLNTYNNVNIDGVYATVGDVHFRWHEPGEDSNAEPGWQKISDEQLEKQNKVTSGLGIDPATYWSNKSEYDFAYEHPGKYAVAKSVGGYEKYKTYSSELYDIKADKDEDGKSIQGSRKEKVIEYVNNLDIDYGERLILFKSEYNADDTYNYDIIDYLNGRDDISYEEMATILKELGFDVDSKGNITWD